MSETGARLYHEYDTSYAEEFNPDAITRVEPMDVSTQVTYVDTPTVDAYVVDLGFEDSKCEIAGRDVVLNAYEIAVHLGAHVPSAVVGPDWLALKPFNGTPLMKLSREERVTIREEMNVEALVWDCAKLHTLGYWDNHSHNLLVKDDGTFRHIDIQSMGKTINSTTGYFIYSTIEKFQQLMLGVNRFRDHQLRVVSLAEYLSEVDWFSSLASDTVQRNIDVAPDIYPIEEPNTPLSELSYPEVDGTVVPPDPPKIVRSDLRITDFPDKFTANMARNNVGSARPEKP